MPVEGSYLKVEFGTRQDYEDYIAGHPDSNTIYYLTDTHQILLDGSNYSGNPRTVVYVGQVDTPKDVKPLVGYPSDTQFIYSVGESCSLYLVSQDNQAIELSKILDGSIGSSKVNFIVDEITNSEGTSSEVPSTKALVNYIKSYASEHFNNFARLDEDGHIDPSQYNFGDVTESNTLQPVNGSSIKKALDSKVNVEEHRDLSTNDFDNIYKTILDTLIISSGESSSSTILWGNDDATDSSIVNRPRIYPGTTLSEDVKVDVGGLLDAKTTLKRLESLDSSSVVTDSTKVTSRTTSPISGGIVYNTVSRLQDQVKESVTLNFNQAEVVTAVVPSSTTSLSSLDELLSSKLTLSKQIQSTNEIGDFTKYVYFTFDLLISRRSSSEISEDVDEENYTKRVKVKVLNGQTASTIVTISDSLSANLVLSVETVQNSLNLTIKLFNHSQSDGTVQVENNQPVYTQDKILTLKLFGVTCNYPLSDTVLSPMEVN